MSTNSSYSSDPSDSSDKDSSDHSSDAYSSDESDSEQAKNQKEIARQPNSTTNVKTQEKISKSSEESSDTENSKSTEPSSDINQQKQNTEKSSSETESKSDRSAKQQSKPKSDSDSESQNSSDSSKNESENSSQKNQESSKNESEKISKSDSNSESQNSSDSEQKETKKEVKQESESKSDSNKKSVNKNKESEESKPDSNSEHKISSDLETPPVVQKIVINPQKTTKKGKSSDAKQKGKNKRSDFESIYQESTNSENENEGSTDSDSEPKEETSKTQKSKSIKERSSTTITTSVKNKKEPTQDSKKSVTRDEKSKEVDKSPKKSKKSTTEEKPKEEKGSSRRSTKKKSRLQDDSKDDENNSRKQKKSSQSTNKRHKRQSKKSEMSDNDDDYEYDNDYDTENRKRKNTTKSNGEPASQLSVEELDEAFEREDAIIEAVYQFNSRKNVSKLCAYFNAEETPEGIAHVIRTTKGLNGEIIGDYLGKKENCKILSAYFMEVDMKCGYIEAMRRSLSGPMFLPGEGQIIDRILQEFANCYVQQNPGKYSNADELYVLSFALVMLNSDLHNRNVQNRMTVKEFIRNTRHLLSAADVTDKELTEMYNEIQSTPFSFTNHSNDFWWEVAPKIRGYLQKKSEHSLSKWTKKYFVLTNSCLYYFKDDNPANEGNPLGVIQLTEVDVNGDSKDPLMIKITATNDEISYVKFKKIPKAVKGIKRISFKAPDRASASRWLHRIKKSAIMSNFLSEKMNENNLGQKV